MPEHDPPPSQRHATMRRLWRAFRLLGILAVVVAGIAVLLVARGDTGTHVHMLVATALMAGLVVLVGGGLMTLVFISASSGHDEAAAPHVHKESDEQ